jgi:hypothetical protein
LRTLSSLTISLLTILAMLALSTEAQALESFKTLTFGCIFKDDTKMLWTFIDEHDTATWQKEATELLSEGQLTMFKVGDVVNYEGLGDRIGSHTLAKVRRQGEIESYWINVATLEGWPGS